ncbi:MAG: cell envelope integrity protein TolA, partial [Clostridia bacterium]|nr:cell envelope integrity protein TolA [Clostridia bacterium]
KAKAEEEARLKAEAEAKAKAEEEARLKAEAEAKAKAEEEARLKAEAEAKAKAEEEARLKAEAEAKAKAEEEARLKAEAEKAAKLAAEAKLMEEAHEFYGVVEPDEYIDAERIEIYMDPNVNTISVGGAVVSDDPANENIVAVAEAAGVKVESLVSLVADGNAPLVFEFADPSERNEVTLQNVYFINSDGKVTMPSRKDNDNILAFGKAFITDVYGFKAFLDRK